MKRIFTFIIIFILFVLSGCSNKNRSDRVVIETDKSLNKKENIEMTLQKNFALEVLLMNVK
jgi:lipoprotein NlpI